MTHTQRIASEFSLKEKHVDAVINLLGGGATVPFIARYRKEMTGSLDDARVAAIRDRAAQLAELDKRRDAVLKSIEEQGKMTPELKAGIMAAPTLVVLEDLYLPYRPKRRTRATAAKEKGLEPLAKLIFDQIGRDPLQAAKDYLDPKKDVNTVDDALQGARDIIAEWLNEDARVRDHLRQYFEKEAVYRSIVIRGKEDVGQNYKDYFDWEEKAAKVPSHRILAVRRAEKENIVTTHCLPPQEDALKILLRIAVKGSGEDSHQVRTSAEDAYKRLLAPSLETELRMALKRRADEEAVRVFSNNLKELLMSPPMGQKRVCAIDPGFRTGCKVVFLNEQGKLLETVTVYCTTGGAKIKESEAILSNLVEKHNTEVIAIGNGTASKETEAFVRSSEFSKGRDVVVVSETGASVYSASEAAREEFPDEDVTVRGAVSIGRRLMDPLAELVKIDPKAIGVGQYQHDVDQKLLKHTLDDTVIHCVNEVGVEVNTASRHLLMYVSGLGPTRAKSIVEERDLNGPFATRDDLTRVSGLGEKALEQSIGFLRIHDSPNPLDASAVHPESYGIVEAMARDLNCGITDLIKDASRRNQIKLQQYVNKDTGLPTLEDILRELAKPGRDPRPAFQLFQFKEGIDSIDDVEPGMELPGVVTNVTAFGAFVDIGIHQDGLVHISQMSDTFVKNPNDILKVHQRIKVKVLDVDKARRRVALTMKGI